MSARNGRPGSAGAPAARSPGDPSGSSGRRGLALLVLAFALSVLPVMLRAPAASTAEERCLGVVQEMDASGDWLVPRLHGEVRLQKPPLAYWGGAAASALFGGPSLFVLRLPSLLLAIGLILACYAWGERLGGPRLGLAAAGCLAAMETFVVYGRRGVAEMHLAFFAVLALASLERLLHAPRRLERLRFALALGLAFLAKATVALLVVGLPAVVAITAERRWRSLRRPSTSGAVLLGLALGLSWYAAILLFVPDGWSRLADIVLLPVGVAPEDEPVGAAHFNPAWFHVGSILVGASPAILLLPWALRRAWDTRFWRGRPGLRFVAGGFVSLFVAFSLLPQKQKHYMLPLLPLLAIVLADGVLARAERDPQSFARLARRLGTAAGLVALLAAAAATRAWQRDHDAVAALVVGPVGALLATTLGVAARRGRPAQLAGTCVAVYLALLMLYGLLFDPRLSRSPGLP